MILSTWLFPSIGDEEDESRLFPTWAEKNGSLGRLWVKLSGKTIELDDFTFHQCVNLTWFNSEKTMISGSQQHGASGRAKFGIKATGGWAFKYADLFKEKLGISLDKADEMDCLVAGINFLLKLGGGYLFGLPVGFVADSIGATLGAGAAFLLERTTTKQSPKYNKQS